MQKRIQWALMGVVLALTSLSGCNHNEDREVVRRKDLAVVPDVPDSEKAKSIKIENDTYKQARREMKLLHEKAQRDMHWDKDHHTWHETYPIAETVPTPPGGFTPTSDTTTTQPPATGPPDATQPSAPPINLPPATVISGHTKKALIVGINKYPGCPLNGCVNDATDIRSFIKETPASNNFAAQDQAAIQSYLQNSMSFTDDDIVFLTDADATTANIMQGLMWLCADAKAGDVRLFWYSGHGAEFAGSDIAHQPDHQNQVICPVDFDWTPAHMIMDVQFYKIFATMAADVIFCWGSDSCHSGDLEKELPKQGVVYRRYPLPPPAAVAANLAAVKAQRGISRRDLVAGELNVGFLSGCNYDEFSADTSANGRPCGADTHYFLETIRTPGVWNKPLTTVAAMLNQTLDGFQYGQHPQPAGARKNKGWMQ